MGSRSSFVPRSFLVRIKTLNRRVNGGKRVTSQIGKKIGYDCPRVSWIGQDVQNIFIITKIFIVNKILFVYY